MAPSRNPDVGALRNKRQQANALDGYNGRHGGNGARNVDVIAQAPKTTAGQPLRAVATTGRGGVLTLLQSHLGRPAPPARP